MSADPAIELKPGVPWASPDDLNRLMRQQGLCLAVAQAAVLDEIARSIPLEHDEENRWIAAWLQNQDVTNDQQLAEWLTLKGWNHADLRYFATKGPRLQLFKQRMFSDEIELRFLERKLQLDQVTYSLIRVKEGALAQELFHRLHDDHDDFATLASQFSQGPERQTGGRIGPVPLAQAHEVVANQLRISEPGQLWPPFFLVNIWLIIRLDHLQPARLDDDVRQAMVNDLFDEWLDRRVGQLLAGEQPQPLPRHLLSFEPAPPAATGE